MRPYTLAFPRTILQKLGILHAILNSDRYFCSTVNRYANIILFVNISNREIKRLVLRGPPAKIEYVISKHGWLHFVDAASRSLTIYLAEKLFCFLNGVVTKNRTLAKPSCHVRGLSKLKSACLIYLCSFVCSVARRVPSFVEAWLCYAHRCNFLALFPLPSLKPVRMAF